MCVCIYVCVYACVGYWVRRAEGSSEFEKIEGTEGLPAYILTKDDCGKYVAFRVSRYVCTLYVVGGRMDVPMSVMYER